MKARVVAAGAWLVSACSSGAEQPSVTVDRGTDAAAMVWSRSGAYEVQVYSAPDPAPARGVNTIRLVVRSALNARPVSDLNVDVLPWMPAMGHGASTTPVVVAGQEAGSYVATNVNLFMPGVWELRITLARSGAENDDARVSFDVR